MTGCPTRPTKVAPGHYLLGRFRIWRVHSRRWELWHVGEQYDGGEDHLHSYRTKRETIAAAEREGAS